MVSLCLHPLDCLMVLTITLYVLSQWHCDVSWTSTEQSPLFAQFPVARTNTFFVYVSGNGHNQIVTIVDFSQTLEPQRRTLSGSGRHWFGFILSWFVADKQIKSIPGQRTSEIDVSKDAQYAMHPDRPMFAYTGRYYLPRARGGLAMIKASL